MFRDDPYKLFPDYGSFEEGLNRIGNAGYMLLLHMHYWRTKFAYGTHPEAWLRCYDQNNFVSIDPVMLWALSNSGTIRWSEMKIGDVPAHNHVMERAKDFGLRYGAVSTHRSRFLDHKKCMICISRHDRELTDAELVEVADILERLVEAHDARMGLSDGDIQTIQALAHGRSQEEIACDMSVSRDAVKKRIERIRKRIGAKNATHVVAIALSHNLIETIR